MILTDAEIEDLIAMETRATAKPFDESYPLPWFVDGDEICAQEVLPNVRGWDSTNRVAIGVEAENAALIVAARNALPSLLAEVKAARDVIAGMRNYGYWVVALDEYAALAKETT